MDREMWDYGFFVIVIAAFVLSSETYQYFKRKRYPNASDLDKAIWKFKAVTVGFVVTIIAMIVFLPSTNYSSSVGLSDPQDVSLKKIVENQEKLFQSFNHSVQALRLMVIFVGGYVAAVLSFIRSVERFRQRDLENTNPETKKPLGL
jgi:hypothetical protein